MNKILTIWNPFLKVESVPGGEKICQNKSISFAYFYTVFKQLIHRFVYRRKAFLFYFAKKYFNLMYKFALFIFGLCQRDGV